MTDHYRMLTEEETQRVITMLASATNGDLAWTMEYMHQLAHFLGLMFDGHKARLFAEETIVRA